LWLVPVLLSSGPAHSQARGGPGLTIRGATPAEVERQIQEEERLANAEPSIGGLSRPLSYYLRTHQPDLTTVLASHGASRPVALACVGDFDGNGLEDTAVFVKDKKTQRIKLMAFHRVTATHNPGGFTTETYNAYRVHEYPDGADSARIDVACERPGKFQTVDGAVTVILKNASIRVDEVVLYYFTGDGYQSLIIGD